MNVHVTLYNAEMMVAPCVEAVKCVYPGLHVHDFGSEDDGPRIVRDLGVPITLHGRLSGKEYVEVKQAISLESEKVFWADADEIWPAASLESVALLLRNHSVVNGYWRNVKVEEGKVYVSDYTHRGAVAWDTTRFELHREWPREKLRGRIEEADRAEEEVSPDRGLLYCFHGVLLNLSHLPCKKNRWKKLHQRKEEFASLGWLELTDLPFIYYDKRILEPPAFKWYK